MLSVVNHSHINKLKTVVMANIKSAIKRNKQNIAINAHKRKQRSTLRTEIKKFIGLVTQANVEKAKEALPKLHKVIDMACTKGLIKKNTASRKKSRLTLALNKMADA